MRPLLNRIAALTLLIGGLLMTGCCGPMLANACRSGCGEVYIDPWINEPVDPCDCGSYNGLHCGSCRPLYAGVKTVWGFKYDGGGCDSCSGCESCGGGCDSCGGHEPNCGLEMVYPTEIGCGAEPTCGFELGAGSCAGCSSCNGGHSGFAHSGIPLGESIIETDPHASARVVIPGGTRVYRERASQPQPIRDRPRNSRL